MNDAHLGLIRRSQRGFSRHCSVGLAFENTSAEGISGAAGYGVVHVSVAEDPGWSVRATEPDRLAEAFATAERRIEAFPAPVEVGVIPERVANISRGAGIDRITKFEAPAGRGGNAPNAVARLD